MNKRKILTLALTLCMVAILAIGGTLAYFTDSDADSNVMVAGNVYIVQNETDRNGDAFENDQKLVPAVYNGTLSYDATMNNTNGNGTLKIWGDSVDNEIDKVISVTNKGTEPAYIRTIVLMENTDNNAICEKIHGHWNNSDGQYRKWLTNDDGTDVIVTIGGVKYSIAVCTYNTALEAGKTSAPSLMQIFVDPTADNEWNELLDDGRLSILALSQAVQAQGFETEGAAAALNTAFGEVSAANVLTWFAETPIKTDGIANVIGGN